MPKYFIAFRKSDGITFKSKPVHYTGHAYATKEEAEERAAYDTGGTDYKVIEVEIPDKEITMQVWLAATSLEAAKAYIDGKTVKRSTCSYRIVDGRPQYRTNGEHQVWQDSYGEFYPFELDQEWEILQEEEKVKPLKLIGQDAFIAYSAGKAIRSGAADYRFKNRCFERRPLGGNHWQPCDHSPNFVTYAYAWELVED